MSTAQQARHEGFADHSCTQYRDHHGAEHSGLPTVSWVVLWRLCVTALNVVDSQRTSYSIGVEPMSRACGDSARSRYCTPPVNLPGRR